MRSRAITAAVTLAATVGLPLVAAAPAHADRDGLLGAARDAEPIVLNGAQIPGWAQPAAVGVGQPYPSGATNEGQGTALGGGLRSAHNGILVVPPDNPGVPDIDPGTVAAYSWVNGAWKQVPVQVDKMFLNFLANGRSTFGFYSGTDEELTYAWGQDAHDNGQEAWKRLFPNAAIDPKDHQPVDPAPAAGACDARYPTDIAEVQRAIDAGVITLGAGETAADYLTSMQDPQKWFDTDDQLSFMASDAGVAAPSGEAPPTGPDGDVAANGQTLTITDPLNPGVTRYVYLFTQKGGSSFNADNGYVHMTPNADASQWIDEYSFPDGSPDAIGTSNGGYGPNTTAWVCDTAVGNRSGYPAGDAPRSQGSNSVVKGMTDANPRDDFTIKTPTYEIDTTGRWLVKGLHVTKPGTTSDYGPNVIARWKGRAFQQTPNSSISVVGFEDEQVNWEMNSALLGWRQGPVRAIREVWGADSGTNVTKTEFYYRDADVFSYHLRVHPIPPDGLYTDWDYRPDVATTYFNLKNPNGVKIDGIPDQNVGEVDSIPVPDPRNGASSIDAETNICDPTTQICSAVDNPEEVAGNGFGLVYEFEMTGATAAAGNVAIIPYYRDDACFDDGTGDAPVQRPFPGDADTDNSSHVEKAYIEHAIADGAPPDLSWDRLVAECHKYAAASSWGRFPFQAAIGEHGVHFLFTQDSDNTWSPKNTDEVDGQQWRFEIPMETPQNELVPYGADVSAKLVATALPYGTPTAPGADLPEVPLPVLLPIIGGAGIGVVAWRRRRRA